MSAPDRSAARLGAGFGLFLLAVAARATSWPIVLVRPGLIPGGADEYYHLRRIWYGVERFPDMLSFDPYLNFPDGARVVWPPLFDWSLAAIANLLGAESAADMERIVAWVPPLLGGCVVLLTAWLAARHFGERTGWLAGLIIALLPAHHPYTGFGRVDHHGMVSLATTLLLATAMAFLARRSDEAGRWSRAGALGVALGGAVLVWPGALLHVGIIEVALVSVMLATAGAAASRERAGQLAVSHVIALVLVLPFCVGNEWAEFGNASPLVLSIFQPAWFGAATLAFAAAAIGWRVPALGSTRMRRLASALGLGSTGLVLAFASLPGLADALDYASGWFAKAEDFQTHVLELRSLFFPFGEFRPEVAGERFSYLIYLVPFGVGALGVRAWSTKDVALGVLLGWTVACFLAAGLQFRFINSLSVAFSIVVAACFVAAWRHIREGRGTGRALAAAGVIAAAVALAVPSLAGFREALPDWRRWLRDEAVVLPASALRNDALLDVAAWLAAHSPETRGYLDPTITPEYGVLCSWADGHLLRYAASRPMVQDNFGVYGGRANFDAAERYFATSDESEAVRLLERLRVRYVLADPVGSGHGHGYGAESMSQRLSLRRGSELVLRDDDARRTLPALSRHRLVFEREAGWIAAGATAATRRANSLKLYERVAGAQIVGRAVSGDLVRLRLEVTSNTGVAHLYRASTRADAQGRYAIRVPYGTDGGSPGMTTEVGYRLASARATARLAVPDAAVHEGAEIAGPDLRGCAEEPCADR